MEIQKEIYLQPLIETSMAKVERGFGESDGTGTGEESDGLGGATPEYGNEDDSWD